MSGEEDLDDSDLMNHPCSSGSQDYDLNLEEELIDVDDAIAALLASLRFESVRSRVPSEKDDEQLRRVHQRIADVIHREKDEVRRRRLRRASPCANTVREQILYLRRLTRRSRPAPVYYHRLSQALDSIVKDSFDEEYRKVAIVSGVVDAIAEVLVLEIDVFGMPSANENRTIRKFIANALTNLTYGHVHSKRKLCAYNGFIPCVVRIFTEAQNLSQVYAGLIRNLSWMADADMCSILSPTCEALARAFVEARSIGDEACIRATLSALWNLASHSEQNKRAISEQDGCLAMLAELLTPDARMTVVVESASGILKYASQYLSSSPAHSQIRAVLASHLVQLLSSASFTVVSNTLSALASLIAKDMHLQTIIRQNGAAMTHLNVLRNSSREDIRSAVKTVLNHLNQPMSYQHSARYGDMSSSLGCDPLTLSVRGADTSRLLPLRSSRASPGANLLCPSLDQRSFSLPRHFARGGHSSTGVGYNPDVSRRMFSPMPKGDLHIPLQQTPNHQNAFTLVSDTPLMIPVGPCDNTVEEFEEVTESMAVTRNTSVLSLSSEVTANISGWQSVLDNSAVNSNRMSPASCSEIPDSPTEYMMSQNGMQFNSITTPLRVTTNSRRNSRSQGGAQLTSDASHGASDVTTTLVSEEPTPTFVPIQTKSNGLRTNDEEESLPGPSSEDDEDYAAFDENDLLQQSIEAALPPLTTIIRRHPDEDDRLLSDMIDSVLPTRKKEGEPRNFSSASTVPIEPSRGLSHTDDRLLMDAIMSAMPSTSPAHSPFHPKNGLSGRATQHATRPHNELIQAMQSSALMPTSSGSGERVRDASRLERASSWESSEEGSQVGDDNTVHLDLPGDVLEETEVEDILIDCSQIERSHSSEPQPPSGKSSLQSTPRKQSGIPNIKSNLPRPSGIPRRDGSEIVATKRRHPLGNKDKTTLPRPPQMERTPPCLPEKPRTPSKPTEKTTKAVVSPYNYQKPKEKEEEKLKENVDISAGKEKFEKKSGEKQEVKLNTKQMLVTTV